MSFDRDLRNIFAFLNEYNLIEGIADLIQAKQNALATLHLFRFFMIKS